MDILSALKSEASKLEQQLDTVNAAIQVLGGKRPGGRRPEPRRRMPRPSSSNPRQWLPRARR